MVIYGVALLAFCMLTGVIAGELLGTALGVSANVGGVGIAMLLLIVLSNLSHHRFHLKPVTESGIQFWSALYIPIVVAMAAKQNVVAAASGGVMAVVAGVAAVAVSFMLVPVLTRVGADEAEHGADNVSESQ